MAPVEVNVKEPLHVIVERVRAYLALLAVVITAVSAGSAWIVTKATSDVRFEVHALQDRATDDAKRFDRAMEVVELVAIALVEPEGSAERAKAVKELRERRHIVLTNNAGGGR